MQQNYNQLIERISRSSGVDADEIDRKVEAKRAKLSGLISKEGAAQIVAAELGINFEKENIKINELIPGMKRVNVLGKIISLYPVREFNKNGREGKVLNMILGDETSNVKTVLWDSTHISLFEKKSVGGGDVVQISNASIRNNELHLGSFSDIKKSSEVIEGVKTERVYGIRRISDLNAGDDIKLRAFIAQVFEPRFFEVCPECNKKAENNECAQHGKIMPVKRALLSLVLDDGSESIRAVLFNEQIELLGVSADEINNAEAFLKKRDLILGEEKFFSGAVRQNKMFNNNELFISGVEPVNIDNLIDELEKQVKNK